MIFSFIGAVNTLAELCQGSLVSTTVLFGMANIDQLKVHSSLEAEIGIHWY